MKLKYICYHAQVIIYIGIIIPLTLVFAFVLNGQLKYNVCLSMIGIGIFILPITQCLSSNLPGASCYNLLFNKIELHVDWSCGGNNRDFASFCSETILQGYEEIKDVYICTSKISQGQKNKIANIFGDSITFYTPNKFDILFDRVNSSRYNKKSKTKSFPLIKAVVHSEQLSDDAVGYLNKFFRAKK